MVDYVLLNKCPHFDNERSYCTSAPHYGEDVPLEVVVNFCLRNPERCFCYHYTKKINVLTKCEFDLWVKNWCKLRSARKDMIGCRYGFWCPPKQTGCCPKNEDVPLNV